MDSAENEDSGDQKKVAAAVVKSKYFQTGLGSKRERLKIPSLGDALFRQRLDECVDWWIKAIILRSPKLVDEVERCLNIVSNHRVPLGFTDLSVELHKTAPEGLLHWILDLRLSSQATGPEVQLLSRRTRL